MVTLHDWDHVGVGRGGREERELQRIEHPPQHGGSMSEERERAERERQEGRIIEEEEFCLTHKLVLQYICI